VFKSNDIEAATMDALSANEAKTHFGDLLLKAQRSPVQINKNGKPVAVIISVEEYEGIEALKLRFLQGRVEQAEADIDADKLVDGESFFDELDAGHFD
jgi:prevent-host-death family protein